jgi:flavin-dependent dehydrogenase
VTDSGELWDVAVVGAGPAGAITAYQMAKQGVKVLLLDRTDFPRRKVCGCCLNPRALAALAAVGLGDLPAKLGAIPLQSVRLATGGRTATLCLGGVSLSREAFDAALVALAVDAGAVFRSGVRVRLESPGTAVGRTLTTGRDGYRAKVVIDATGLNGKLTDRDIQVKPQSRIGAGTVLDRAEEFYRPGVVFMAVGQSGYVGLVRVENSHLDIAAAFDPEWVRTSGSLASAAEQVLREAGFPPPPELRTTDWKGTPPLTQYPMRIAGYRWFAVGDAAGYVEPFTGEGMAWAIAGAIALAPIAVQAVHQWEDRLIRKWSAAHGSMIARRQFLCRFLARVLRSPSLCRMLIGGLGVWPGVASPFIRALN